jgi:hypothetical protein
MEINIDKYARWAQAICTLAKGEGHSCTRILYNAMNRSHNIGFCILELFRNIVPLVRVPLVRSFRTTLFLSVWAKKIV